MSEEDQARVLHNRLLRIYNGILNEGKISIFGDIKFEIVKEIDRKKERIAKQKGNKIFVRLDAVFLPDEALKYVVAHEIAHLFVKKHTEKFWRVVEIIYPDFRVGQKELTKYRNLFVPD
ncbi:MAG: M48 family metallopeptidase [Caldisericaceae bacterium]